MTPDSLTTVAKGDASEITDPARFVVRDADAWRALWSAHAGAGAQPPDVDFAAGMVAAAFAGERPSPGYGIEIVGSRREGSSLAVMVKEELPPRGTIAAQVIVTPFHIVTMPRHDGEVRFADASGVPFRPPTGAPLPPTGQPQVSGEHPASRVRAGAAAPSSTGLDPSLAATLAYLAGPFSGILIALVERSNDFVRFHAWQAVLGLGGLGLLSAATLVFSFLTLLLSPMVFTVMYRVSELLAIVWVVVWALCLMKAFSGARFHMPVAGRYAERLAARAAD
jgi:uncharacterized membrane protein